MTLDIWPVTPTCDMWHVTHGGGWTFSKNFNSQACMVLDKQFLEDSERKDDWINKLMKEQACCARKSTFIKSVLAQPPYILWAEMVFVLCCMFSQYLCRYPILDTRISFVLCPPSRSYYSPWNLNQAGLESSGRITSS